MRFRDNSSADPTGTAERELDNQDELDKGFKLTTATVYLLYALQRKFKFYFIKPSWSIKEWGLLKYKYLPSYIFAV